MGYFIARMQESCCHRTTYYTSPTRSLSAVSKRPETTGQYQVIQLQPAGNIQTNRFNNYLVIYDDHKFFYGEGWYEELVELNMEPEKFLFVYRDYYRDQENLLRNWRKIDVKHEVKLAQGFLERTLNESLAGKWKYLLRVPCRMIRDIIIDIFKLNAENQMLEYRSKSGSIKKKKKENDKKYPALGVRNRQRNYQQHRCIGRNEESLKAIVKCPVLNDKGIKRLQKILNVLSNLYQQVQYNPMIVQVGAMLMIFCSKAQTFCILQFMIYDSRKLLAERGQSNESELQRSLRWHFMRTHEDFARYTYSFIDTVYQRSKTFTCILEHFKKIQFNYFDFFQEATQNLFFEFLEFPIILRIFVMFLNEGIKIYYRMVYALCRVLKSAILAEKDPQVMLSLIKKRGIYLPPESINRLIKKAFILRLPAAMHQLSYYSVEQKASDYKERVYYQPHVNIPSQILSEENLEMLWDWLPDLLRMSDLRRIWSTQENGYNLAHFYRICETLYRGAMLVIIQSKQGAIFGFFSDTIFQPTSKKGYYGGSDTFVFYITPSMRKYINTKNSRDCHLLTVPEYFSVGAAPDGPALRLDADMNKGQSYRSEIYENPVLTGYESQKDFYCKILEAYIFE